MEDRSVLKPAIDWLDILPEEIRIIVYAESNWLNMNCPVSSFYGAMIDVFYWNETEEGHEYWHSIAKKYNNPPL